jgi:DNA invertase Pin-like site-specific DNA recombinase
MKKAIAYYRVSTERQGKSGLGLEAQKEAVRVYTVANGYEVISEHMEIESGRKSNRPQLLNALSECKRIKAILIIAKLDRLGRNVAFIAKLMENKVQFVAVDNPHATDLVLHITAAFAQFEREQISTRIKEALQAAKRRGVILGKNGREVLSHQNRQAAQEFADLMQPAIDIAERGYIVPVVVQQKWAAAAEELHSQPGFAAHFMPRGRAPKVGELFQFPAAARGLRAIAQTGGGGFAMNANVKAKALHFFDEPPYYWTAYQKLHLTYAKNNLQNIL